MYEKNKHVIHFGWGSKKEVETYIIFIIKIVYHIWPKDITAIIIKVKATFHSKNDV
jgi:hypothetical protein